MSLALFSTLDLATLFYTGYSLLFSAPDFQGYKVLSNKMSKISPSVSHVG